MRTVKTDAELDALAKAVVKGKVKISDIKIGGCPKCGGRLESHPLPCWMNRSICGTCGWECSQ